LVSPPPPVLNGGYPKWLPSAKNAHCAALRFPRSIYLGNLHDEGGGGKSYHWMGGAL
jgi:hypothetical protein